MTNTKIGSDLNVPRDIYNTPSMEGFCMYVDIIQLLVA